MPQQSVSLAEFASIARNLLNEGNQTAFARFVLSGIWGEDATQAIVDPMRNTLSNGHPVSVSRDYDSLLALVPSIPLRCTVYVYPISRHEDNLSTTIHISHSIDIDDHPTQVPIHRIPNIMFAKWGERHMIRAFFPDLYDKERAHSLLTQQEQETFYQSGLYPAIQELLPAEACEWPPSYRAELFRAQQSGGRLSFGTKAVGDWAVSPLGPAVRRHLVANGYRWGGSLIFLLQIRGTKHGTSHGLHAQGAREGLDDYLRENHIPRHATEIGKWWIDVGLVFRSDIGHCLQWRTDSHRYVYHFTSSTDVENATRVTLPGSSKYSRDMVSHLPLVSGCRVAPGVRAAGCHELQYFQLYTTDKALTYNPEGRNHGKTLKSTQALGSTHPTPFGDGLYKVYTDAITSNASHARLEVRVPYGRALDVLLFFPTGLMRNSLLSFTKTTWWYVFEMPL